MAAQFSLSELLDALESDQTLTEEQKRSVLQRFKQEYPESVPSWEEVAYAARTSGLPDEQKRLVEESYFEAFGKPSVTSQIGKALSHSLRSFGTIPRAIQYLGGSALKLVAPEKGREIQQGAAEKLAASFSEMAQRYQPVVESIRDVRSVGDFGRWLAERGAGLAPDVALAFLTSGVSGAATAGRLGAKVFSRLTAESLARGASKEATEALAKQLVRREALKKAATAAALPAALPAVKDYASLVAEVEASGSDVPFAAGAAYIGAQGMISALPIGASVLTSGLKHQIAGKALRGILDDPFLRSEAANIGKAALSGIGAGAAMGAASPIVHAAALKTLAREVAGGLDADAVLEGMATGGVFGGVLASISHRKPPQGKPGLEPHEIKGPKPVEWPGKESVAQRLGTREPEARRINNVSELIEDQIKKAEGLFSKEGLPTPEETLKELGFGGPFQAAVSSTIDRNVVLSNLARKIGGERGEAIRSILGRVEYLSQEVKNNVVNPMLDVLDETVAKLVASGAAASREQAMGLLSSYQVLNRIINDETVVPVRRVKGTKAEITKAAISAVQEAGLIPFAITKGKIPESTLKIQQAQEAWKAQKQGKTPNVQEAAGDKKQWVKLTGLVKRSEVVKKLREALADAEEAGEQAVIRMDTEESMPYGITTEKARKMLSELYQKYPGLEAIAEEFTKRSHEIRMRVLDEMAKLEPKAAEVLKAFASNPHYATFLPHFEHTEALLTQFVEPSLTGRTGFGGEIESAPIATVAKFASLYEHFVRNQLRKVSVDALNDLGLAEPAAIVVKSTERESPRYGIVLEPPEVKFREPKNPNWTLITFRDGTEVRGAYVPKVFGDALSADPAYSKATVDFLRGMYSAVHSMFISYNPAFAMMNRWRDIADTSLKNPELAIYKPRFYQFLMTRFLGARREAQQFVDWGILSPDLKEMVQQSLLAEGIVRGANLYDLATFVKERYPLLSESQTREQGNAASKAIKSLLQHMGERMSAVPRSLAIQEVATKLAGYKVLKREGVSGEELAYRIRNMVGTPNYMRAGRHSLLVNSLFNFFRIRMEGWRSSIEAIRKNPWTATLNAMPFAAAAAVRWGLASGAALALFDYIYGEDAKNDEDLAAARDVLRDATAIMAMQTRYNLKNYNVIPVALVGDPGAEAGLAIRMPMGHVQQFVSNFTYSMLDALTGGVERTPEKIGSELISNIASVGASELPSVHPAVRAAADLVLVSMGVNPPDAIRGGPSIPRSVFDAGRLEALKFQAVKDARSAVPQIGESLSVLLDPYFRYSRIPYSEIRRLPFVGPMLGSVVQISNYGLIERQRELQEERRSDIAQHELKVQREIESRLAAGQSAADIVGGILRSGLLPRPGYVMSGQEVDWLVDRVARTMLEQSPSYSRMREAMRQRGQLFRKQAVQEAIAAQSGQMPEVLAGTFSGLLGGEPDLGPELEDELGALQ